MVHLWPSARVLNAGLSGKLAWPHHWPRQSPSLAGSRVCPGAAEGGWFVQQQGPRPLGAAGPAMVTPLELWGHRLGVGVGSNTSPAAGRGACVSEPAGQLSGQLLGGRTAPPPLCGGAEQSPCVALSRYGLPRWLRWQSPRAEPGLRDPLTRRWDWWGIDGLCTLLAGSVICWKVKLSLTRTQN